MEDLKSAKKIFISMLAGDCYREKQDAIELAINLIKEEMNRKNRQRNQLSLNTKRIYNLDNFIGA